MSDLIVMARHGRWMLVGEDNADLGAYATKAEALAAAGAFARVDCEPRHVLVRDDAGEWHEELVEPASLH
jgi:hypothetical protein